jgi:uncharacterized Zn finger protein
MALTKPQRETVLASLHRKVTGACPMCGQRNWTLGDEVVGSMATSLHGGVGIGGPLIPMVQVVCNNCGFVAHHAIGALGIKLSS